MTDVFWPGWKAMAVVGVLTASAIGYAAALRFLAIEDSTVALACDAGRATWPCGSRKMALAFSQSSAFGTMALGAALLNLVRPSVILVGLALSAAGFGLVLYNTAPSAVAVALVALSLARPRPEPE